MRCSDTLIKRAVEHLVVALKLAMMCVKDERLRRGLGKAARQHWRTGWRLFAEWLQSADVGASRSQAFR